jgi:hypothetical protein
MGRKLIMTSRVAFAMCQPASSSGLAQAEPRHLIGLDNKITYGAEGRRTALRVMTPCWSWTSQPGQSRASLPLANSSGPPQPADHTRRQAGPGRRGSRPEGNSKIGPDDKLYVIDLTADPPS